MRRGHAAGPSLTQPTVRISDGVVRGASSAHGAVFLGIPYAAPPVGDRRYLRPRRPTPWAGIRDAMEFAPPLPQPSRSLPGVASWTFMGPGWNGEAPQLAVNVWTPGLGTGSHPVLVFFHGGGFVAGAPSAPIYDGDAFARDGIVFVSANYRLGVEGFLPLDGGDTNVGIRDQLAALAWVQSEIGAFGGDAGRVTVYGQSAGAICIGATLGSRRSRGLFQRAIVQSGGASAILNVTSARRVAGRLAGLLGVSPTREAFTAVSLADVIAAQAGLVPGQLDLAPDPSHGLLTLMPVHDDDVVPGHPLAAIELKEGADVPLLIGDTVDEGNLYVAGDPRQPMSKAEPITRRLFREPTAELAAAHRRSGSRTHLYEFAWPSSGARGRLGAAHAVDLPFVFDSLDTAGLVGPDGLLGRASAPQGLADQMHSAWVGFIREGDPGWDEGEIQRWA
jgi:para-nitrobenzyl esterase